MDSGERGEVEHMGVNTMSSEHKPAVEKMMNWKKCEVCGGTGKLQDAQAWDCGQDNSQCPYCDAAAKAVLDEVKETLRGVIDWANDLGRPFCEIGVSMLAALLSSHDAQAEENKRLREALAEQLRAEGAHTRELESKLVSVMAWAHKNLANRCKTCGTRCATACYHCGERGTWKGWTPAWEVQP